MTDVKKAISTIDLALSAINVVKTVAIIFGMVMIEWYQQRKRLAENEADVSKTELSVKEKQIKIERRTNAESPDSIIDRFLGR